MQPESDGAAGWPEAGGRGAATRPEADDREGVAHLRALVLGPTRLFVHWRAPAGAALAVRCSDLSGRPPHESLDGVGWRRVTLAVGQNGAYLEDLPPGHVLWLELGELGAEGLRPLAAAPPVTLPWAGPVVLPRAGAAQVSRS